MKANLGAAMAVVAESWYLGFLAKKISVDNAYKNVSAKTKKKNDKVRTRKVNFKKQEDLFNID